MFSFKRKVGNQAEDYALKYLENQQLKLLRRNYLTKFGEIDLIMLDGDCLVFVEVRYRKNNHYGNAYETVDWRKQKKLIKTAQLFLTTEQQYQNHCCRFDIISLTDGLKYANVDWLKNAFQS